MKLNKGTFFQNPHFLVFYSYFVQNQVTAPCKNCFDWQVAKYRSSVFIHFFFINPNDTSKIPDGDDANRRDKIFQIQTGKQNNKNA